jgi:16S rRNA (adenine1518-N6/adenine1519-N6)-dimethyltransferase
MTIRPLKKYGQNFLRNRVIADKIVRALDCRPGDHVLEIGAGEGVLTERLAETAGTVISAVEIDPRLAGQLESRLAGRVAVIRADFLDLALCPAADNVPLKIIGNIPYYLTSDIIFKLLGAAAAIERAVLMVQKEVAGRLSAKPGGKDYSQLTVLVQTRAACRVLFEVGRENFYPVPGVDSAVVLFEFHRRTVSRIADQVLYGEIIRRSFAMRRKMLRNSLREILHRHGLSAVQAVSLERRPEELSVDQFVALANEIAGRSNKR